MGAAGRSLTDRIWDLDTSLLDAIPGLPSLDQRALLALHAAVAQAFGRFAYLEVGSYLGGSLQALVRDERCTRIMSIDPRLEHVADERPGGISYPANTTAHMLRLLGDVPGADTSRIWSAETTTSKLDPDALPARPRLCFVDGEHTDEAVLHDARWCREALGGPGVIAFHDAGLVKGGIREFLRESWPDIRFGLLFGHQVFAVEYGERRVLRSPVIQRAVDSAWHMAAWRAGNIGPRADALVAAWTVVDRLDPLIADARARFRR